MFRVVLYLFLAIILISVVRSVIGVLGKFFQLMITPAETAQNGSGSQLGGELKRDPVCGTYISTATSIKKTIKGGVVHFCSPACRDKFAG